MEEQYGRGGRARLNLPRGTMKSVGQMLRRLPKNNGEIESPTRNEHLGEGQVELNFPFLLFLG